MLFCARFALPCALLLLATPALAEQLNAFGFNLKRSTSEVEGAFVVDGYSVGEMRSLIGLYCEGSVGDIALVGKPKKKRGLVVQKFQTICSGGPSGRFQGSSVAIEVELGQSGEYVGQHVAEITTSDGKGNLVYLRETVSP